jgi:NAD-dependent dihydropyrimidine dehydrogenase PreA subunit
VKIIYTTSVKVNLIIMPAIDPDFKTKREKIESDKPYDVYGPVNAPETLGIHGSVVAVDFDICIADGVCIDVCPTAVFDWVDTPGTNPHKSHPDLPPLIAEKKAAPSREDDCIFCMACEIQCPVTAIKIFQP